MTFPTNSNMARMLTKIHDRISRNYDYFAVITGDEGVGKSRGIMLNVMDYWYKHLLGKSAPKSAFCVDFADFPKLLRKAKKFDFVGLDEAGDALDTQNYANKVNRIMYQTYTVIREKGVFTCVVLPSIFDLNPRFRKRRVRLLIHVNRRVDNKCRKCLKAFVGNICPCGSTDFRQGYIVYSAYTRKQLLKIFVANTNRSIKSLKVAGPPMCTGTASEYKGELAEYYTKLKRDKADNSLKNLSRDVQDLQQTFSNPKFCTMCRSLDSRYLSRKKVMSCRACGNEWAPAHLKKKVDGGG